MTRTRIANSEGTQDQQLEFSDTTAYERVLVDLLAPKTNATWKALKLRFEEEFTSSECRHLFARYVLGLTTPLLIQAEPTFHLVICRLLLERVLLSTEATIALETVPDAPSELATRAFHSIEQIGLRDGRRLRDHKLNTSNQSEPRTSQTKDRFSDSVV